MINSSRSSLPGLMANDPRFERCNEPAFDPSEFFLKSLLGSKVVDEVASARMYWKRNVTSKIVHSCLIQCVFVALDFGDDPRPQ